MMFYSKSKATARARARAREGGTVIGKGGLIMGTKFGQAGLYLAGDEISRDKPPYIALTSG